MVFIRRELSYLIPLKTALIGIGRVGWGFHLPNIVSHAGFNLCAVVDLSEDRLLECKEKYHVNGYKNLSDMLEREHPDLVVIASPTHLHREHAETSMRAGADVFLDKPMANSYAEACSIAKVSEETGRKIMIYQPHRAVPETVVLQKIFKSGILGPIYMIKRAVSSYERRNDWQTLKKFGGGMLANYGAHYIDQMLYLTQAQVIESSCRCHRIATFGDAEDVVKIVLGMNTGITIDIDINCATAFEITPWMVFGKYGTAIYEGNGWEGLFRIKYYDPHEVPERTVDENLAASGRAYNTDCAIPWKTIEYPVLQSDKIDFYDKCYATFAEDAKPFVPLTQTLSLMKIITEMKHG